jgi:two-component system, OmpR family, heavy metal sensor histidine kinase CusS
MSSKTAPDAAPRKPWSLAGRLTLWYAASSFVLLVAFAGFVYWALILKLEGEDDQFMAEKVEVVRVLLRDRADVPAVLPADGGWAASSIYLRVLSADGRALLTTAGMDALPPELFPQAQGPGPIRPEERRLPDGRFFRVASVRAAGVGDGRPPSLIHVAMDRTHEMKVLAAYRWYLAAALASAVLACSALGYRIARHGLRLVVDIAATASRIRSSTLNERIDPADLPAELRTLADTFNAMLDRLEQSFARLRQFSADIAHELRTPVNNMRGEIEVALGKSRTGEEYREVLGSSLEECGRLAGMIDSMLFLARAENPRTLLAREPVDVAAELVKVREFYEASAAEAGVRLEVTGTPVVANLNRPLFQRAMANLVANALAHTPPGGTVTLTASAEDGAARVEVADTGRGIAASHLPHVFDRFYRVDGARSAGGAGLGLAIVRSVVEMHGGRVEIASEVGRGTRVVMTFPGMNGGPAENAPTRTPVRPHHPDTAMVDNE